MAEKDSSYSGGDEFAESVLQKRNLLQKRKDTRHLQRGIEALDKADTFPADSEEHKKWRMHALIEANILASRIMPPESLMAERIIWSDPVDARMLDDMHNPRVAMFVPLTFKVPATHEKREYRKSATLTWLGEMHDRRILRSSENTALKKRSFGIFKNKP